MRAVITYSIYLSISALIQFVEIVQHTPNISDPMCSVFFYIKDQEMVLTVQKYHQSLESTAGQVARVRE